MDIQSSVTNDMDESQATTTLTPKELIGQKFSWGLKPSDPSINLLFEDNNKVRVETYNFLVHNDVILVSRPSVKFIGNNFYFYLELANPIQGVNLMGRWDKWLISLESMNKPKQVWPLIQCDKKKT